LKNAALLQCVYVAYRKTAVNPLFMQHPGELSIKNYTYDLPEDRIALHPLAQRDASKLLVYQGGKISETVFSYLSQVVPRGALLVFNNTRVVPARLLFQKATGGHVEIFALEPVIGEVAAAMAQTTAISYTCLVKKAVKWKEGTLTKVREIGGTRYQLQAEQLEKSSDAYHIRFHWQPEALSFAEVLQLFGEVPIPPYLHRPAEKEDEERYQTIFARYNGSVAAPTAGLHFTDAVLQSLTQTEVELAYTTLHVGAGTFKPVKAETLAGHDMHTEWITVEKTLLERLLSKERVIAVGTTSLRTLESLYWLGLKTLAHPAILPEELHLGQWEVYEKEWLQADTNTALKALLQWMEKQQMNQFSTQTQILIAPGYQFKICQGLITNFHQPQSTLLLLIAALIGNDWRQVYDYALQHGFRFLSYGDSSLLMSNEQGAMNNEQ
jgi:S-adenosylmethionine:tRNA ribosyltransferase-isomerase